jgi:hypothetical protein
MKQFLDGIFWKIFCEEGSWELPRTEQFGKKKGM